MGRLRKKKGRNSIKVGQEELEKVVFEGKKESSLNMGLESDYWGDLWNGTKNSMDRKVWEGTMVKQY